MDPRGTTPSCTRSGSAATSARPFGHDDRDRRLTDDENRTYRRNWVHQVLHILTELHEHGHDVTALVRDDTITPISPRPAAPSQS